MNPVFDIHIFACGNQRPDDKISCGAEHSTLLVNEFKTQINELGVKGKIRTQKAGCLGICKFGPTLAIYPEGVFYVGVTVNDVKEIVESHLLNKIIVERLLVKQ
jgi:(2Fe-2S) ferredoxin